MPFEKACFIKATNNFNKEFSLDCPAPIFRKKFNALKCEKAIIKVCGLGYGYYYINGKPITEDLFIAPVSNFEKTVLY